MNSYFCVDIIDSVQIYNSSVFIHNTVSLILDLAKVQLTLGRPLGFSIRCNPTYMVLNNTNYSGTLFHQWGISQNHALFNRAHFATPAIDYLSFWLRYRLQVWTKMCLRHMFILVLWTYLRPRRHSFWEIAKNQILLY